MDEVQHAASDAPRIPLERHLQGPLDTAGILRETGRAIREVAPWSRAVAWLHGPVVTQTDTPPPALPPFDPADPLLRHLAAHPHAVAFDALPDVSSVVDALRATGPGVIVPLVVLGELVDALLVWMPAGEASGEVVARLEEIAFAAAAALRTADLARYRAEIERATARTVEELQVALAIQRSLLPESLPDLPGWRIEAHYQPAQVVGGDLYDFIPLPNDLLGIVLGDVTDKSVPAALMMAAARTLLRVTAQRIVLPGQVLARVNEDLGTQMPPGMFVTCFFAILDPASGRLRYANAGQSAPLVRTPDGVRELRARGWPLGMMPGASYEEAEIVLGKGSTLVCFSDGLVETHAPDGAMYGTERVSTILSSAADGADVLQVILEDHQGFAGPDWIREDDLTMLALARLTPPDPAPADGDGLRTLDEFTVPSDEGVERGAAERVVLATRDLPLTGTQRNRLLTAVAETVMNAAEHGNRNRPDLRVRLQVLGGNHSLVVRVFDEGRNSTIPEATTPDLAMKLEGQQSPRGWGLFLIEHMVDRVRRESTATGHMVELVVELDPTPRDGA